MRRKRRKKTRKMEKEEMRKRESLRRKTNSLPLVTDTGYRPVLYHYQLCMKKQARCLHFEGNVRSQTYVRSRLCRYSRSLLPSERYHVLGIAVAKRGISRWQPNFVKISKLSLHPVAFERILSKYPYISHISRDQLSHVKGHYHSRGMWSEAGAVIKTIGAHCEKLAKNDACDEKWISSWEVSNVLLSTYIKLASLVAPSIGAL